MLDLNTIFDESYYLAQNPDVSQAVAVGAFSNALEHFLNFGQFERRDPSALFDTDFYLALYPDVEAAVMQDESITAIDHFLQFGQREGLDPLAEFDTRYYLDENPDVAAAVERDELTGIQHFLLFGQFEGRNPNDEFDTASYFQQNGDVAAATSGSLSAIQHFLVFGKNEGRRFEAVENNKDLLRAEDLGTLGETPIFQNSTPDSSNIYLFTLPNSRKVTIDFDGLTELDSVSIGRDLDRDLIIDDSEFLAGEIQPPFNNDEEPIIKKIDTTVLPAGTYFLRVNTPPEGENSNYSLSLSAQPDNPTVDSNFDPNFGKGLVDAKQAIEGAIGSSISSAEPLTSANGENFEDLNRINVASAWANGFTGQDMVVAVIDNGVDYNHLDLQRNIWTNPGEISGNGIDDDGNGYVDDIRGWDFADNDNDPMPKDSEKIHGTHVSGTIAAGRNGVGTTGVAYEAQIMPLKTASSNPEDSNTGNSAIPSLDVPAVSEAIRYAADNGANIINASLSLNDNHPEEERAEIEDAIDYAVSKDAVVVLASGNQGRSDTRFPASLAASIPGVIAVGAVDNEGLQAQISNLPSINRETNSDLKFVVAPGIDILSTSTGRQYETLDGTSMATPHVAGVAALIRQANPNLTPVEVVDVLTGATTVAGLTPFDPSPDEGSIIVA
ncbi:S8 family peptidase [Phormidium sp. CCY1219]|uniref:S8 family peptidase n=1 Tax=Phormidium sp. CCY1219 TaxID=2886104 RepID=UPI002D1F761D|nr:S8 family peptidase [Phormidium sp. CCY1219]MEB3830010.1 S8 family serine peptidase [Phormidium sp. CCY1219]